MSQPQTTNDNPPTSLKDLPHEMSPNVPECPNEKNEFQMRLTESQLQAIRRIIAGQRDGFIAKHLKISRKTLYRWKTHHPLFRLELSRRRQGLWHNSADKLRSLLPKALKVLNEHLDDRYDKTRFRAALHTLRLAGAQKITPPNEPTELDDLLTQHCHQKHRQNHPKEKDLFPPNQPELDEAFQELMTLAQDAPSRGAASHDNRTAHHSPH